MIPAGELSYHLAPQKPAAGIRRVISSRYGSMLWTPVSLRKSHACGLCGCRMDRRGWRPITFGDWRMIRICRQCWPEG